MHIVFPLFAGVTALDVVGPYEVLRMLPGAEVTFAATAPGPVTSPGGLALTATHAYRDVDSADVLVVPGGPGARSRTEDPELTGWLRAVAARTTWTTSVCTGSLLLAGAGLLDGLDATTHWSAREQLESYGARYVADRVVRQGKVVTAAGVSAGIDMALTLAALLADEETAQVIQLLLEYDPQPPFRSGSPASAPAAVRARAGA
ncbi:DJ-1/PfpI family protein [Kitasatospora sp. LaBMicrA B282]|uniref:DJ-1/PfpI family protein n=1 Tax=Kitasatospora sp. LaBMicrA B282 TaxID=3420949 RepID=UPI003D0CFE3D